MKSFRSMALCACSSRVLVTGIECYSQAYIMECISPRYCIYSHSAAVLSPVGIVLPVSYTCCP
jgi:hypothetical protein